MANGENGIDKAREQKDLEYAKKIEREQRSPFFSGGAAGQGQSAVFDPEMSARIQAFGTDLRNPDITNPNFAFSLRDPSFTPNSSYLNTGPVNPTAPVVPGVPTSGGINRESMFSTATGESYNSRDVLPSSFKFDIDNASAMALMNRIDGLVEKRKEGTITDLERQELLDLNNRLDELTTKNTQGAFSNQALLSLLPQLFSQPMEQSELDRQYAKDMSEYQARQQQIAMQRQRETLDRSNAFQFAKSILPNFDFSGMENELDPKLLPELIRYAMNKAQLSASKQNQRMAQPIVKFA